MYIGTYVQITSKGGPYPDVNIVYSIQNGDIASIDTGIVHALKLGRTKVVGRSIGLNPINNKQMIYSEDHVNIHVIPIDGVRIRTPLIRIKAGAVMPATIWGNPDISPMVLGTLPNLKVYWSTDQPNVIQIKGRFEEIGVEYSELDSISTRIVALAPGKARIHAVVHVGGSKYAVNTDINVFKTLELEAPKRIVYDPIMIPPRSKVQLRANMDDVTYVFDDKHNGSIVKVNRNGVITSADTNGRELIIASSQDQSLTIPVEVKNVHYILASLNRPDSRLRKIETKLPTGLNVGLKISLHDNIGNEFSHDFEDLDSLIYRLSNRDLIETHFGGNFSINLNLVQQSSAILGIALKDATGVKYAEDYLKLSVGESLGLYPKRTSFTSADIICFDSPLLDSSKWKSSDPKAVVIDESTGLARVLNKKLSNGGKVTVTHGDTSSVHYDFKLDIKGLDKIEFIKKTDIFNGERYIAPLVLKNHQQIDKFTNLFASNITTCKQQLEGNGLSPSDFFSCNLNFGRQKEVFKIADYFKTVPHFDLRSGAYSCLLKPIRSYQDIISLVKSGDVTLQLSATLTNGITDSTSLKLVPAIGITPDIILLDQIDKKFVTISGLDKVLQEVQVKSSHPEEFTVSLASKQPGAVSYRAKQLKSYTGESSWSVIVTSPHTGQSIDIPILPSHYVNQCSKEPLVSLQDLLLSSVSSLGFIVTSIILIGTTFWSKFNIFR